MNKVFISHSSNQAELVKRIVKNLGRDHCIVDCFDFQPGEKLKSEIQRKIDDAHVFCLLISNDSIRSNWVKFEESYAREKVEAEKLVFQCFIVDDSVDVSNKGISDWEKAFIINSIPSAKLISRILGMRLRELDYDSYRIFKLKNTLFYGRGAELSAIENAQVMKSEDGCKAVIISGLPHVGRKRFAEETLKKISCDQKKGFCSVQLKRDQSIEDLILFLNDYVERYDVPVLTQLLAEKDMRWKRNVTIDLLNDLYSFKQHLLIIDDYCLIRADGRVTEWFCDVLRSEKLENYTGIYITTVLRVDPKQEDSLPVIHQMLHPLKNEDMRVLFQSYAHNLDLHIGSTDVKFFAEEIGGFPIYVYSILDEWLKNGRSGANLKLQGIKEKLSDILSQIVDLLNTDDKERVSVLVLLAKCDVISVRQLSLLFPDINIDQVLDYFYGMSILEYFGYAKEYVHLHPVVADYINRSRKISLPSDVIKVLSEKASRMIKNVDVLESNEDLPTYLYGIKNTLKSGLSSSSDISRYLVPSLALSVIVEEYEEKKYPSVEALCLQMIGREKNYDKHILRSVHYWYCLALCRLKKAELLREVNFFAEESSARHFLLGFYYRLRGNLKKALDEYDQSLQFSYSEAESSKTKQELVVVKIMMNDYDGALTLAEENYRFQPHNSFFIEAYFRCLVKYSYAESSILLDLIDRMERSLDKYRQPLSQTMRSEYIYYRDHDYWRSIELLQGIIEKNQTLKYPQDALKEICQKQSDTSTYLRIQSELAEQGIRF